MRTLNAQMVREAAVGFRALYKRALRELNPVAGRLAMDIPSGSPEEVYVWLNALPRMRKWVGDRVVHALAAGKGFRVVNEPYEATIGVDRRDLEYDRLGIYKPQIMELARSYDFHRMQMLGDLVVKAFDHTCWDGQYFFDTDHPVGRPGYEASVSNRAAWPLSVDAFWAARAAMRDFKDEEGQRLGVVPNTLVVGPKLEGKALDIAKAEQYEGSTNTAKGLVEVLVLDDLADMPTAWALMDLSREVKPLLIQTAKKGDFVAMDADNDEAVFSKRQLRYGVDCEDAAAYALWILAFGSTGDGSAPT